MVILVREWLICGNKELSGKIKIDGAKNSLLAILIASIMSKDIVHLENVTPLKDTYAIIKILKKLNVRVLYDNKSKMIIDSRKIKNISLVCNEIEELRASYYFMGALLSIYKKVEISGPGGCEFATRPIDLHLKAFNDLGYSHRYQDKYYVLKKEGKNNKIIRFSKVSVGATINAILASCKIKGMVKLVNVALEPEIDDLIDFLNKCGAKIKRIDNDIVIKGVSKMHGCQHKIMQDRIEAGTYILIGACIGKDLIIEYNESDKLKALIDLLKKLNVDISVYSDKIKVSKIKKIDDVKMVFDVYPSLPTDLQQLISVFLSKSKNCSVIKDKVYPTRYTQIDDLNNMGFKMMVKGDFLYVYSSDNIVASETRCKDLRGGASLVMGALLAKGTTKIKDIEHINRGYYKMLDKLKKVGAIAYEKD